MLSSRGAQALNAANAAARTTATVRFLMTLTVDEVLTKPGEMFG